MYIYFNCNILTDDRKLNTSKGEPKRLRVNSSNWCRNGVLDTSNTGQQCITEKSNKKAGFYKNPAFFEVGSTSVNRLNFHFAMNTEQGAFFAMELLVLPRKNFSKPLLALLPTTIRSAEVLAAKSHMLSGANPSNSSNFPLT